MANNNYRNCLEPGGSNWNDILDALPKNQRGPYKLQYIAQIERQKIGTPSFRILDVYDSTLPQGRPWIEGGNTQYGIFLAGSGSKVYALTIKNRAVTISLITLNVGTPVPFLLQDTVTAAIWELTIVNNALKLTVSTGVAPTSQEITDVYTNSIYYLLVKNGGLTLSTVA